MICKLRDYDEILGGCSILLGKEIETKEQLPVSINSATPTGKSLQEASGREGASALAGVKKSGALQTSIDIKHFPCSVGKSGTCAVNGNKTENTIAAIINMAFNLITVL